MSSPSRMPRIRPRTSSNLCLSPSSICERRVSNSAICSSIAGRSSGVWRYGGEVPTPSRALPRDLAQLFDGLDQLADPPSLDVPFTWTASWKSISMESVLAAGGTPRSTSAGSRRSSAPVMTSAWCSLFVVSFSAVRQRRDQPKYSVLIQAVPGIRKQEEDMQLEVSRRQSHFGRLRIQSSITDPGRRKKGRPTSRQAAVRRRAEQPAQVRSRHRVWLGWTLWPTCGEARTSANRCGSCTVTAFENARTAARSRTVTRPPYRSS